MVTLSGTVKESASGKAISGKAVTMVITKPDSTTETLSAVTDADGSFSATYNAAPGNYTAKASTAEDAVYLAGTSLSVPFSAGKIPVTVTLLIS